MDVFACKATACLTHNLEFGTGQPLEGNKLTSKAASSMSFENLAQFQPAKAQMETLFITMKAVTNKITLKNT